MIVFFGYSFNLHSFWLACTNRRTNISANYPFPAGVNLVGAELQRKFATGIDYNSWILGIFWKNYRISENFDPWRPKHRQNFPLESVAGNAISAWRGGRLVHPNGRDSGGNLKRQRKWPWRGGGGLVPGKEFRGPKKLQKSDLFPKIQGQFPA